MNDFFKFAGEHPILSFLIVCIVCGTVVKIFRGYPRNDD
jgi:hypothetical protein